ncbi:hypothetical protein ACN47E_005494 [Coniothyrium glycines]
MGEEGHHVDVDAGGIGLDRVKIASRDRILLPDHGTREGREEEVVLKEEPETRSSTHRVVNSLKQKKHDAGVKVRKTLHIKKASDDVASSTSPILAQGPDTESGSRLDGKDTSREKLTAKEILHHPVDAVKAKTSKAGNQQVAANIAAKEVPHGQDVDVVKAADAVDAARTHKEKEIAVQNLDELLKLRQSTYVRWTLDRHVTNVRILPRDQVARKPRAEFETRNPRGEVVVDWRAYGRHLVEYCAQRYGGQYVGYGSKPPVPSKETIMPNIERLVVATSPFQEFVMTTRRVYRWEQPRETVKYLIIYMVLWTFNLILPGIIAWVIYIVVERRVNGVTIEALREDIKHTEDVHATALSLTEFIEKKGEDQWADEIMQDLGPWLMIQLADLANFFESLRNFYEWRKPHRTASVVGVLSISVLFVTFTPQWLLTKSLTFALGFTFFALWPLAANFPEYRLLVSPTKRLLWNIPTHGEWAVKYIQAEGSRVAARALPPPPPARPASPTATAAPADDYGFYLAHHDHMPGHLVLSTQTLRFVSRDPHTVHFSVAYADVRAVEKVNRVVKQQVPDKLSRDSGQDIKIKIRVKVDVDVDVDVNVREGGEAEREVLLKDVEHRDEAWSQIVGFCTGTWQIVW